MLQKYHRFSNLATFFKHTDYYGYVQPYNYFEWTSYVREDFFQKTVPGFVDVLSRPIKMMTTKISCVLYDDSAFGDNFEARLTVGKIKRVSFDMVVRFLNQTKNAVVCKTEHTIVFADEITNKFANIPEEMAEVILNYREDQ